MTAYGIILIVTEVTTRYGAEFQARRRTLSVRSAGRLSAYRQTFLDAKTSKFGAFLDRVALAMFPQGNLVPQASV